MSQSPSASLNGPLSSNAVQIEGEGGLLRSAPSKKRKPQSPSSSPTTPSPLASYIPQSDTAPDTDGWTKVEKRKAKKARKNETSMEGKAGLMSDAIPRFFYVNSEIVKRRDAIGISDIRDVALHLLGDLGPQSWLKVENRSGIRSVVVLLVPGILPEHLDLPPIPSSATKNPNLPLSVPLPPNASNSTKSLFAPGAHRSELIKNLFTAMPSSINGEGRTTKDVPLPFVSKTFSHAVPTKAPGDTTRLFSVLGAFFDVPLSREERAKRQKAAEEARMLSEQDKDPKTSRLETFIVPTLRLLANNYPLPSYEASKLEPNSDIEQALESMTTEMNQGGWIETPEWPQVGDDPPEIIAVDCEMVQTTAGKELARACFISFSTGKVFFDMLVKPGHEVVDYLTKWSGITEETLSGVSTTLADVQKEALKLLSPPPVVEGVKTKRNCPILLGHSLESDLSALRLAHPRVIDTALLFHHPRMFTFSSVQSDGELASLKPTMKPGLAWLTRTHCGRIIQQQNKPVPQSAGQQVIIGHDAEEDARACIELLQRKLDGPPNFGEVENRFETERLWTKLGNRNSAATQTPNGNVPKKRILKCAVLDRPKAATFAGATKPSVDVRQCANDEEVAKGIIDCFNSGEPQYDFVWARMAELAEVGGWTALGKNSSDSAPIEEADRSAALSASLSSFNTRLASIWESLPPRTALVLFTGHGDPRTMVELQKRKSAWESLVAQKTPASLSPGLAESPSDPDISWTTQDVRSLEEAVELSKRGLLFLAIK